jgi:hypothetical protein
VVKVGTAASRNSNGTAHNSAARSGGKGASIVSISAVLRSGFVGSCNVPKEGAYGKFNIRAIFFYKKER